MPLRQAELADLDRVETISREAYAPWIAILGGRPLPMDDDYAVRIARQQVWLLGPSESAAVLVLEQAEDHLLIYSLAVPPTLQGQGLGRTMMAYAEQVARDRRLPRLRLFTSDRMTRNIDIYRRAGFTETGRRPNPYREGWVLVDMAKPVSLAAPP